MPTLTWLAWHWADGTLSGSLGLYLSSQHGMKTIPLFLASLEMTGSLLGTTGMPAWRAHFSDRSEHMLHATMNSLIFTAGFLPFGSLGGEEGRRDRDGTHAHMHSNLASLPLLSLPPPSKNFCLPEGTLHAALSQYKRLPQHSSAPAGTFDDSSCSRIRQEGRSGDSLESGVTVHTEAYPAACTLSSTPFISKLPLPFAFLHYTPFCASISSFSSVVVCCDLGGTLVKCKRRRRHTHFMGDRGMHMCASR